MTKKSNTVKKTIAKSASPDIHRLKNVNFFSLKSNDAFTNLLLLSGTGFICLLLILFGVWKFTHTTEKTVDHKATTTQIESSVDINKKKVSTTEAVKTVNSPKSTRQLFLDAGIDYPITKARYVAVQIGASVYTPINKLTDVQKNKLLNLMTEHGIKVNR